MQTNNELNADKQWTKCRQNSRNADWTTKMQTELLKCRLNYINAGWTYANADWIAVNEN